MESRLVCRNALSDPEFAAELAATRRAAQWRAMAGIACGALTLTGLGVALTAESQSFAQFFATFGAVLGAVWNAMLAAHT